MAKENVANPETIPSLVEDKNIRQREITIHSRINVGRLHSEYVENCRICISSLNILNIKTQQLSDST